MTKGRRIIISGYYGFSNVGDEAILLSLHRALRQTLSAPELIVLSANPQQTERDHGLRALPRLDLWRLWRALSGADLLISGGGSLFQDVSSARSLYYYLGILLIGMLTRTPLMIYAQGIGPLRGGFNRRLTAWMLNRVSLITVRDQESLHELRRLGVNKVAAELTADPVLALSPETTEAGMRLLREIGLAQDTEAAGANGALLNDSTQAVSRPLIGISIRPWVGSEHLIDQLCLLVERLITEHRARVVLIPMHYPGDDQITADFRERLGATDAVGVLPKGAGAQELISLMGCLNLLIGVRLHALVFAAIAGTPAIAISYDPKVDHFAARMEQCSAGPLGGVQAEKLWQQACELLEHEAEIRRRMATRSAELRDEALRTARLAAELLGDSKLRH